MKAATRERRHELGQRFVVNFGPHHPSTHGVFRMVMTLDGETVVDVEPVFGYLHRNHEKIGERNAWIMNIPFTDRLDYISSMSNNLGYVLWLEGEVEEAAGLWRRALAVREAVHGPDHPEVAVTLENLGLLAYSRGELAEAERDFARALAIKDRHFEGDRPGKLGTLKVAFDPRMD